MNPSNAASHTSAHPHPRCRPGERPTWVSVSIDESGIADLRKRAAGCGAGVDAWCAALLEWEITRRALDAAGVDPVPIVHLAEAALKLPRLAPSAPLRTWARATGTMTWDDELPSLCLPTRVVAQIPAHDPLSMLSAAIDRGRDAVTIDRAAALEGLTLDAWALRTALNFQSAALAALNAAR